MNPIKHPFRLSMAALLCGVLAYRASAWELPLRLSENTGQGGLHQISGGVPLLAGQAMQTDELRLVALDPKGNRTVVPAQFRVLARWWREDQSIRWVLVDFAANIGEFQTKTFWLCNDASLAQPPAGNLTVAESDSAIVVTTGPAQFTINRERFNFLDSVRIDDNSDGKFTDDEELLAMDAEHGLVVEDTFGVKYRAAAGVRSVEVVERGPVRVSVRAKGVNLAPEGEGYSKGMYQYDVFLNFYADSADVKADLIIANNFKESVGTPTFKDASLLLKLAGGAKNFRIYGESRIEGRFVGDESYTLVQDSNGADSWRVAQGHYGPDTSTFRGYKVFAKHSPTLEPETVREGAFDFQRLKKKEGAADGEPVESEVIHGSRARGVTHIRNERFGIVMHTPHFWEQFPKAVGVGGDGTLRLALFPREYKVPHFFEDASGKGHNVVFGFYSAKRRTPYAAEGDGHIWPHVFADMWDSVVFPMPPMEHKAATGALTDVGPFTPPLRGYEAWPMDIHYRRMLMTDRYWGNGFGWQVFGSRWQSQGGHSSRGARQPIKEDNFLYRFYMTEDRSWQVYGDARSRHFRDVRSYRIEDQDPLAFNSFGEFKVRNQSEDYTSRPQPKDEESTKYSQGKWHRSTWWFPNPAHCTLDLLYDRYLLTGDIRAFENMRIAAGHGAFFGIDGAPRIHRDTGWSWRTLERYWELTGDARADELLKRMIAGFEPLIGQTDLWFKSSGYQREWFTQVLSRAAAMTALHTRDPKALEICRALASDKADKADYFCTLFAVLYHLTGEESYKQALLKKTGGAGESLLAVSASGDFPATAHWLINQPPVK